MSAVFTLAPGEAEIQRWTISRRSFAIRTGVLLLTTFVALSPLGFFTNWVGMLISATILLPTYMWVCDDFRIWRDNAGTVWMLSNEAVHVMGPEDEVALRLPLQEVRAISALVPWSLVLRLEAGTAITLPLPPEPRKLRAAITAARDALEKDRT